MKKLWEQVEAYNYDDLEAETEETEEKSTGEQEEKGKESKGKTNQQQNKSRREDRNTAPKPREGKNVQSPAVKRNRKGGILIIEAESPESTASKSAVQTQDKPTHSPPKPQGQDLVGEDAFVAPCTASPKPTSQRVQFVVNDPEVLGQAWGNHDGCVLQEEVAPGIGTDPKGTDALSIVLRPEELMAGQAVKGKGFHGEQRSNKDIREKPIWRSARGGNHLSHGTARLPRGRLLVSGGYRLVGYDTYSGSPGGPRERPLTHNYPFAPGEPHGVESRDQASLPLGEHGNGQQRIDSPPKTPFQLHLQLLAATRNATQPGPQAPHSTRCRTAESPSRADGQCTNGRVPITVRAAAPSATKNPLWQSSAADRHRPGTAPSGPARSERNGALPGGEHGGGVRVAVTGPWGLGGRADILPTLRELLSASRAGTSVWCSGRASVWRAQFRQIGDAFYQRSLYRDQGGGCQRRTTNQSVCARSGARILGAGVEEGPEIVRDQHLMSV